MTQAAGSSRGMRRSLKDGTQRKRPSSVSVSSTLDERIIAALTEQAMPFAELRALCRVRAATLHEQIGASSPPAASPKSTAPITSPSD
jgi:hypothetical protein